MLLNEFQGKVVLVTGGTRGIGKAVVDKFMELGADVAFTYNSSKTISDEIENNYENYSNKVKGYQLNLGSLDDISPICKQIVNDFGKVDILVNNAGMTKDGYLSMMKQDNIKSVIQTNLVGMMSVTQVVLPGMLKRSQGSIINISSISGVYGNAGQTNYSASKAGVIGFTKSLAIEVASKNVRVNAISPGYIKTDMLEAVPEGIKENFIKDIPMRRLGDPMEIANVVVFLASSMSSFIVGQNIIVDGGA